MEEHPLLRFLLPVVGGALVLLAVADVFMTVLYARVGTGPVSHRLSTVTWATARRIARRLGRQKDAFLSFFGPLYLVLIMMVWIGFLLFGFTLIAWPNLGRGIQRSQGAQTPTDFATAFYYAGGSMATVGSGDLRPVSPAMKVATVIASVLGLCVMTLTLTYVIQIYTALQRRNALALSLHHASGGTGDAAVLLAGLGPRDDFTHAESQLSGMATETTGVYESHHFYSVLIYFRFEEPFYAMARGTLVLMELLALIETALDDAKHGWLKRAASITQLREAGMHVLTELAGVYLPSGPPTVGDQDAAITDRWRTRYRAATDHLRRAGISITGDPQRGEDRYVQLRRQWDPYVMAFAHYMEHPCETIDPMGADPAQTAHHREMPTPPLRAAG
jgi:hypothetical protein